MIELKGYETKKGLTCYLGSVKNILAYYKVAIDEHIIYGIGSGFEYVFEKDPFYHTNSYKLHTNIKLVVERFLKSFCIQYSMEECVENNEIAEKHLINSLSKGQPVIFLIKEGEMTYDPVFNDFRKEYNTDEWNHLIVAIGLDLENRRIKISDCYIASNPPKTFQGWCSYDNIKESRAKVNNFCFRIDAKSLDQFHLENKHEVLMEKYLIPRLKKSIMQLLSGETIGESYFGIHALEAYHDYLLSLKDCCGNELEQVLYNHFIDWEVLGFLANKKYLGLVVQEISDVKKSEGLRKISKKITANYNDWKTFWMFMLKISISQDVSKVQPMANEFRKLYQSELAITSEILKYI